jgi:hypothetical protein
VEQSVDLRTTERVSRMALPARLQQWLREPLLHFLVIGLVLFAVYGAPRDFVSVPLLLTLPPDTTS